MAVLSDIERWFSVERMAPYLGCCNGDQQKAVELDEWNARMSAALWLTLGHVEVLVRNAMHARLTHWSRQEHGDSRWYLTAQRHLSAQAREAVTEARRRVSRSGRDEAPGRVVAELTLAFWRNLTASRYDRSLWRTTLHYAFPGQERHTVASSLREMHLLRNRIAHHEPVHQLDLARRRQQALDLAEWVDPGAGGWISRHDDVARLLLARP